MPLRFLLFTSDEVTATPVCRVLGELGVEGEPCSDALIAVEKVTNQSFHIVIIDWDKQPEAGLLLTTARGRKAAERPLTLAIVSDDASIPKALQAGANSILHKPIQVTQIKDTLTTARDLLRAQHEKATPAPSTPASAPTSLLPAGLDNQPTLRAGEFLQSTPAAPGGQFVTESQVPPSLEQPEPEPVDPLKDLEPVAGAVADKNTPSDSPSESGEPKGLQWYLKTKVGRESAVPQSAAPRASGSPELLGFDQMPSATPVPSSTAISRAEVPAAQGTSHPQNNDEQKSEDELFAYIDGKPSESEEPRPGRKTGKGAIVAAVVMAVCAIAAAPQAPWHPQLRMLFTRGRQAVHSWLNPQPAAPQQAPTAHEDFGRAGDEYKLPVAENIPDATTDPSQIQVLPAVDPTLRKPNNEGSNGGQPLGQGDVPGANPAGTNSGLQVVEGQTGQASAGNAQPETTPAAPAVVPVTAPVAVSDQPRPHNSPVIPPSLSAPPPPAAPALPPASKAPQLQPVSVPGNVPSSLKSQIASTTPDAGGNKSLEAALPSIEPVTISEATARGLLADQPDIAYPDSAKGQQGTVVLQLLIGRDGTVEDAKFLQGSFAFARAAIDGVKQWKFKPYLMNGRAVSVQTPLSIAFKRTP